MDVSVRRGIAYGIAAVLLVTGVICYAAFPKTAPPQPVRIMLENTGGRVFFDHKAHLSDEGYGIACIECHHTWDEGKNGPESCTDCHAPDGDDPMKRSDALHLQCIGCHEGAGAAPVQCAGCHMSH